MKVFFDHNMSPALARAFRELFRGQHEIALLREKYSTNITDLEWITDLSRDGLWVVVSGDRRITRNKAEQAAFRKSNLIGFFLAKGVYKAKVIKQTERILAMWDTIEIVSATVKGGAMFELPMRGTRARQLK